MDTLYTIYKVTNNLNGKVYIGSHKTKKIDDGYMGSGKYLLRAIEKHGVENFTKEILFIFETPEEMYSKEAELVNEEFLETQNTYNLKVGGFGGFDYLNSSGLRRGCELPEMQKRLHDGRRNKIANDPTFKKKAQEIGASSLRKAWANNPGRMKEIASTSFLGRTHSEETKNKMRELAINRMRETPHPHIGSCWITSGTENKKIKKGDPVPTGWRLGRIINTL